MSDYRDCAMCGVRRDEMSQCSKCKATRYCSRDCQRADWSNHKQYCGPSSRLAKYMSIIYDNQKCRDLFYYIVQTYTKERDLTLMVVEDLKAGVKCSLFSKNPPEFEEVKVVDGYVIVIVAYQNTATELRIKKELIANASSSLVDGGLVNKSKISLFTIMDDIPVCAIIDDYPITF